MPRYSTLDKKYEATGSSPSSHLLLVMKLRVLPTDLCWGLVWMEQVDSSILEEVVPSPTSSPGNRSTVPTWPSESV